MNIFEAGLFRRTELLLGDDVMQRLHNTRVIIFGVGGVGSWCAESLVRSGIVNLTVVDSDRVCVTNVNRQSMATTQTVGEVKVEALKKRLLEINPSAKITALQTIFSKDTCDEFDWEQYDYVIDAIDSISNKVLLIQTATHQPVTFFSSMGAALKVDASRIKVAKFWDVIGCPLAALLRKRIKKYDIRVPNFLCVYSDEVSENRGHNLTCGQAQCLCPKSVNAPGDPDLANHEWCTSKTIINGSMAHITAIFGFHLAGLVIQDVLK
ncbi:MAG: tRNA threonylcarbamoyladenosine dehydratase [Bacteroidales bacterium]|jgi:tRNA A37 threonylcarbamoyladenosine dehydratase|nr:tRNA threonylcarbamoyladenosine dehydratase [Bacteroidales bacterium]